MILRVVIADDEPASLQRLRYFLDKQEDIEIVAECVDGQSALEAIRRTSPDLMFLDFQMPELNGLEVVRKLPVESLPFIIFVTAHNHFALEAFDLCAVDYLLKPFDQPRFQRALNLARQRIIIRAQQQSNGINAKSAGTPAAASSDDKSNERLAIRSSGRIILIEFDDISWINGAGNYIEIHVGKSTHLLRQTLASLEIRLPNYFARISKSHLVNVKHIRDLKPKSHGDSLITLLDGTELSGTRNYRASLRTKLNL